MKKTLPHFKQLLSFEAAARFKNFTLAAKELNITHSAVSQNIKNLEKELNTTLLERNTHSVQLTPVGEAYFSQIKTGLTIIANASEKLKLEESTLSINVPTSFSLKWLEPRLKQFEFEYPKIQLRIVNLERNTPFEDFEKEKLDLSINYGSGYWEQCCSEKIIDDKLIIVSSPLLLKNQKINKRNLFKEFKTIIITSNIRRDDYKRWCKEIKVEEPPTENHRYYTSTANAIDAVIDSEGIFVTHKIVVDDAIKSGKIVKIINNEVKTDDGYYLVYPEKNSRIKQIKAFSTWLTNALTLNTRK